MQQRIDVINRDLEASRYDSSQKRKAYIALENSKSIWKCFAMGLLVGIIIVHIALPAWHFVEKKWLGGKAPTAESVPVAEVSAE